MSKQEEIREGMKMFLQGVAHNGYYEGLELRQLEELHSQGVVIKVERELPILHPCEVCEHCAEGTNEDGDWISCSEKGCGHIKKWKLKAGYTAVESLIEEKK